MGFHQLRIDKKSEEAKDAYSFSLEMSDEVRDNYNFKPGQYLTIRCEIAGQEYRRAYSICTAPYQGTLAFMVKRLSGGKVSNHLIDNYKEGDSLEVMTPEGRFTVKCGPDMQRDHYFFAGGSGITPIISMVSEVLETEPQSVCYLLYASRDEENIIFKEALRKLRDDHDNQFIYEEILSQPQTSKKGGIKGLFSKPKASWKGLKGRLTTEILRTYMNENPSRSGDNAYYICGPLGFMETVENFLKSKGYEDIKKEQFTNPEQKTTGSNAAAISGDITQAEIRLNGQTFSLEIPQNKTILDALIDLDKDPPYSCTSGACSTCMAKVTEGEVDMDACFALDDEEIEDGYVLTCQAKCKSAVLKLDYET